MRRTVALSALTAVALAPLAWAAPVVGPEQGSAAQFRLTTRSGVYTVSLLASTPAAGGAPVLRLRLVSDSGAVSRFAGALPAGALVTQGGVTTLRTRIGSTPLSVVFRPQLPVITVSFGTVDSDNGLAEGWTIAGNGGTAAVSIGAVRCTVTVMASGAATVVDTDGYGSALRTPLGLPLKGGRCDDIPDTPLPV